MTFRQFEAFAAVARLKNVTKAARELHTSQPSISKHLKSLEYVYKTRLLKRVGRGVELTRAGAELFTYIVPILAQLEIIHRRFVKDSLGTGSSSLKVGGTHVLSATILPVLLKFFHEHHPTVPVLLRTNPTIILQEMVIEGTLEIALISGRPHALELVAEQCIPLKLVAFAAKGYQLPDKRRLDPQAVGELPLIIRGGGTQKGTTDMFLEELRGRGYNPKVVLECESPESLKMAVKQRLSTASRDAVD